MHVPFFWSRKWFKYLVLMVMLYAVLRIWYIDQKNNKFYNHFTRLRNLQMWSSHRNLNEKKIRQNIPDIMDVLPNCGITDMCPENTFPAHIHTGHPKLCVMGKYLTNHASHGGRGLNIALIDPKRLELRDLVTFDVYQESSIIMELWINTTVKETDIVLIFTYDEASRMLRESSRKLFYRFGIDALDDCCILNMFIESLNTINVNVLVVPVMVSPPSVKNAGDSTRIEFCKKHKYLEKRFFCTGLKKLDSIAPMPLWDRSLIGNVIFSVPIAIIATESSNNLEDLDSFFMTLESLIQQPGIDPNNVYVFCKKSASVVAEIVQIYKFHLMVLDSDEIRSLNDTCTVGDKVVQKAIEILGRKERYVLILHISGLILSPDFLSFMAQLVPIADVDRTIIGISAWNSNGYASVSNNAHLVYRAQQWPGVAFLIRSDNCNGGCKINMDHYCVRSSSPSGIGRANVDDHILFPDVSRVLWRPYPEEIKNVTNEFRRRFVTLPRITNTLAEVVLRDPNTLVNSSYYEHLQNLVRKSIVIQYSREEIDSCLQNDSFFSRLIGKFEERVFTIYYDETDEVHQTTLKALVECFGIFTFESLNLGGDYYGVFRFTLKNSNVLLIKLNSNFGRLKMSTTTLE